MSRKKQQADDQEPVIENQDAAPVDEGNNTPSFRDDKRSQIYAKREAQVAAEIGADPEPDITPEPTPEPTQAPEPQSASPDEPTPNATDAPQEPPPADGQAAQATAQKHKLVINGQPAEYTMEELLTLAQKGVGADQKFQEAAQLRRQAQELMYGISQQHSQGAQPSVNSPNQQPQVNDALKSKLTDIAKRLDYGTEEDRVKALFDAGLLFNEMKGSGQGPSPDVLVNAATQQALAVINMQNEQQALMTEFSDILSDLPIAHATDLIANQLAHKYAVLGQPKTRLELFREAGNMARERYLKPAQASAQPNNPVPPVTNVVPMNDKLERKRTAPQPPAAANAVANAAPKEQAVTPSAIVAAMKKARGQA